LHAGRVGRPHGLDGSFHVTRANAALLQLGNSVRVAGSDRRIERRAGHESRLILRLEGCLDREAAEAMRGDDILVPRSQAPELGQDEWWAEDLEGCSVHDGGQRVGRVRRLISLPSCEALEVQRSSAEDVLLVPLVGDAVRSVDIDAGEIDIDLRFLGET
jgi:16S rRNA processing protein RimM